MDLTLPADLEVGKAFGNTVQAGRPGGANARRPVLPQQLRGVEAMR